MKNPSLKPSPHLNLTDLLDQLDTHILQVGVSIIIVMITLLTPEGA